MKKRNVLKVQLNRRCTEALPYRYSQTTIIGILAIWILVGGTLMTSCGNLENKRQSFRLPTVSQDSLSNPFLFENMGFPYVAPFCPFGGLPYRPGSKEARELIEKVFLEEGINLKKDFLYENNDVNIMLNGFDEELNIGYVWVGRSDFGVGMESFFSFPSFHYLKTWNPIGKYNTSNINDLRILVNNSFSNYRRKHELYSFIQRMEKIDKYEDITEQLLAYKKLYLDFDAFKINLFLKEDTLKNKLSRLKRFKLIRNLKRVINTIESGPFVFIRNPKKKNDNIRRTLLNISYKILEVEDINILAEEAELLSFMIQTYSLAFYASRRLYGREMKLKELENIFLSKSKDDFISRSKKLIQQLDDERLSIFEAQQLENIGKFKKDFIAPISQLDIRFMGSLKYTENDIKKELETQVRQYIQWAKQQGGY